jgi:hypothetical protein
MWGHVTLELLLRGWAHPQHTRGASAVPQCWAPPIALVALGLRWVSHDCAALGTSGAWVMALDSWGMGRALEPMINGFSVKTQFYWVLHQDSIFLGPKILNIIFFFKLFLFLL